MTDKKWKRRNGSPETDKVFLGLQKIVRCRLCEQDFKSAELPGLVSYKRVVDLRKYWGLNMKRNGKDISPNLLYEPVPICVYCMQFISCKHWKNGTCSIYQSKSSPIKSGRM